MAPIPETRTRTQAHPVHPKPQGGGPPRPRPSVQAEEPRDTVVLGKGRKLRQSPSAAVSERTFSHRPLHPPDLTSVQDWKPGSSNLSPSQANQRINDDYHRLNRSMQRYLAGDRSAETLPTVPDWMTFGKYASREAGEQIRNLENFQKARGGDLKAAGDLSRDGFNLEAVSQALSMGKDTVQQTSGELQGIPMPHPVSAAVTMNDRMDRLSRALIKGNSEIHHNIAPAYDLFLSGESSGEGGMKKLRDAGYAPGSSKDPQGFVTEAFECYRQARQSGIWAQRTKDGALKAELLEDRRTSVERGNLMLGIQEQLEILQQPAIYGDPEVQLALRSVRGQMTFSDANGKHRVGSLHQDWTDFASRMGMREVAADHPQAIAVRDAQGATHHYLPDPDQPGTIVEYFSRHTGPDEASQARARNLIQSQARDVVQQPESTLGCLTDDVARKTEWLKDTAGSLLDLVL